ncbi:hypothetical protein RR46_01138 [Papilio xuthus]|uniref:Uncharacterized protein n=1 Tax=Papilio xuthus TaxID=66420 RepID=A0A0N0PA80_PAPXU|nr:hypothetical protein RR46_01138 [Papilio xuthus]
MQAKRHAPGHLKPSDAVNASSRQTWLLVLSVCILNQQINSFVLQPAERRTESIEEHNIKEEILNNEEKISNLTRQISDDYKKYTEGCKRATGTPRCSTTPMDISNTRGTADVLPAFDITQQRKMTKYKSRIVVCTAQLEASTNVRRSGNMAPLAQVVSSAGHLELEVHMV